jgi:hypothetical protein
MANKVSRVISRALLFGFVCCSQTLDAQEVTVPRAGERLSDWLLRQPEALDAYPLGLSWRVPAERESQQRQKQQLLLALAETEAAPADARERLARMIEAMPVTGRVPIPLVDARWLQAHPKKDPVLQSSHTLRLPLRPNTVSVIVADGRRCTLPHQLGSLASAYLNACEAQNMGSVDRVWLVQPDAKVRDFGIAQWNLQKQDEPAPGAIVWAPTRDSGWSPHFSAMLAKFLSTQDMGAIEQLQNCRSEEQHVDRNDSVHAAQFGLSQSDKSLCNELEHDNILALSPIVQSTPARDAVISANDWGVIGLLQTPTARMSAAGEVRYHYSDVYPYTRHNVLLQPMDWLEGGFRYSTINNRKYGPYAFSGDQAYLDKSLDFKVRLLNETANFPQVALGITDIGGTGLFSSEYLVASKRSGDFDWSLGIGWGYMGNRGNIKNPLTLIDKRFKTRVNDWGQGGTLSTGSFFRGRSALFGGVQYHTPWDNWVLKAEYEGNDYQHEPLGNKFARYSPVNIGLVYSYAPGMDFNAAFERGNKLMLGVTLHFPLNKLSAHKVSDPSMVRVLESRPTTEPSWDLTAGQIGSQSKWLAQRISREGDDLRVVIESASGTYWDDRIERMTAVLHRDAPASIKRFVLTFVEKGVPMTERVIDRDVWVAQQLSYQSTSDRPQAIVAVEPRATLPEKPLWEANLSRFGYSFVPSWQQNLGGPDGFLFSTGVATPMGFRISDSTSVSCVFNLAIYDNYDKFNYTGPSNLPRARTLMREYSIASKFTMPTLQVTHMGKLGRDQYYSIYGGMLESMYAGVGGEWLYRSWHSDFAFGVDINRVQQRGFKQDFNMRDYYATTGHATAYWDTGWKSIQVKLSVGQYLAEDKGVTMDISRSFNNGVLMGAWATKTNVSAVQFGEGSFDKGIYLRIPFDAMTTIRTGGTANLAYHPLTRDGGAKLNRSVSLYDSTYARSERETGYSPAGVELEMGADN